MVIKVYISGISGSKEVKKRQQRALLILDSVHVTYEQVDITEPGREDERNKILQYCKSKTNNDDYIPLPPQFFNDDLYCGDYEDFNSAVDINDLHSFLKLDAKLDGDAQQNLNNENLIIDAHPKSEENEHLEDYQQPTELEENDVVDNEDKDNEDGVLEEEELSDNMD